MAPGLLSADAAMLARLGFVASVLSEGISTSRTCRLKNATPPRIRKLIADNLAALQRRVRRVDKSPVRR